MIDEPITVQDVERLIRDTAFANDRVKRLLLVVEERDALTRRLADAGLLGLTLQEQIIKEVALAHDLSEGALLRGGRAREFAHPRQEVMWRLRQERLSDGRHRWSLTQIARILGLEDHSTVIHGCRQHEGRLQRQKVLAAYTGAP